MIEWLKIELLAGRSVRGAQGLIDLVCLETMPEQHRSSHRAAGNWGQYPRNGAERRWVASSEADEIVAADEDGYDNIVVGC